MCHLVNHLVISYMQQSSGQRMKPGLPSITCSGTIVVAPFETERMKAGLNSPQISVDSSPENARYDVAQIMGGLYGDGIIGFKNAFSREWTAQLHEDILTAYDEALARPGGAVGRGP